MPNEIQVFNNPDFGEVRTTVQNGEPWFVGKDVCRVLGYQNPSKALSDHVDEEDKLNNESLSSLGQRGGWLVNESGLYSLILGSKLPTAKKFKHWVTSEVLPSIRKHGAYATAPTIESIIANPLNGIKLLQALADEQEKRKALEAQSEVMKPKALFADAVAASDTTILVRDLAKILKQEGCDIGGNRLFAWLRDHDYLCKSGKSKNMPTQKSMELGLFKVREGSYINSKGDNIITKTCLVTGKGQIYFVNKFKEMQETA